MKHLKRMAALLLAVLQIFLLCGCAGLDEMRKAQAFYGEGTDILWNGTTYKLLPTCEYLQPEMDTETTVWLTADDVPVLLSEIMATDPLEVSKDGAFLASLGEGSHYCREDLYQQITQRIKDGFTPELLCYSYGYHDYENWEYVEKTYTLSDEQADAVELVTTTVEPETLRDGWSIDYEWSVTLEQCSKDMLFRRADMEISYTGRTYYLLLITDSETLAFEVPSGCNAIFGEITQAYRTSWEELWDETELEEDSI